LEARSVASSDISEPRDQLDEGRRVQDELERRSNASSASSRRRSRNFQHLVSPPSDDDGDVRSEAESQSSMGTTNSMRALYKGGGCSTAATGSLGPAQSTSDAPIILDKVELAIAEAKRIAMEKVKDTTSASGSGSHSNVGSASAASSLPSVRVPPVLPPTVVQSLQPDKKKVIEKVVTTVVEKTGAELAQMQAEVEQARAMALAEAREKEELEAKLAKVKATATPKVTLIEALQETRDKKIEVEEERDDLKDKLIGVQTLLDAKVQRHIKEKEELRQKTLELEQELKRKPDAEKERLKEELAIASKEMEKAKKQKIAMASERDIIARAEMLAKKAHEAELEAVKSEVVAAKVELKQHGIEPSEVLPIVEGERDATIQDDTGKTNAEKILAIKLREQRENNKKLHQDFERLRLEMLTAHRERENEIAELKAKVEVQQTLPGRTVHAAARSKRGAGKRSAGQMKPLQSIDEEEDEDMASQAGSGVSGQVSSDCDGDGVGDLRDFDDYDATSEKVLSLTEKLIETESWNKHLDEVKKAKEAEYQAKIQRLAEQLQQARQEAVQNQDWVRQLEMDKQEIECEKQAEVSSMKAALISTQMQQVASADTSRTQELEEKLAKYTNQVIELKEQLSSAMAEKKILNVRLADTRRELEASEERHMRTIEQLQSRLRQYGEETPESPLHHSDDLMTKMWNLEEERNLLRNELEGQQVHWQSQLETEQRQCAAALAKLKEERDLAEKDRELKRKVEDTLADTQRQLKNTRQVLSDTEAKLEAARAEKAASVVVRSSFLDFLRCPTRAREDLAVTALARQLSGSGVSCQAIVWQIVSAVSGVAALLCSDDGLVIRDASKRAFTMWGSATLRGSSVFKLIYDESMASWLQTELEAPAAPAFATPNMPVGFWLRDLGFVEFRSRLGSAFEASVICVRLPEESGQQPPVVVVVVQPVADGDTRPGVQVAQHYGRGGGPQPPMMAGGRSSYRQGPGSVASSVHSEDITANDSVSNVNARW